MAIFKCKMCGGSLEITSNESVATCEYCGTQQTVPAADDEKKLILFERAEKLRKQCEFDKAAGIYETIVADFREEAEAYWGLVLCKYGIEYVDDPATGKKIPTCHRTSFDSVMDDADFEQTLENADSLARKVYREEAKAIEEIRKGIVEVSAKEEPYDIFICYKETDEKGERTVDSVLAQDVYDVLTDKGYRVFFARISLEDKLGQEYEPYIFAALNSAKVMLAFGTDYEYFNAVWVKNEWARFLELMAKDKSKHLIPCYKGIDAYDMPKEFAHLQAQDLGKVGAVQDLLRGIEKLFGKINAGGTASSLVGSSSSGNAIIEDSLRKAYYYLSQESWKQAELCLNSVLGMDPDNVSALIGYLMLDTKTPTEADFAKRAVILEEYESYKNALELALPAQKKRLTEYNKASIYNFAQEKAKKKGVKNLRLALRKISGISDWADAKEKMILWKKQLRSLQLRIASLCLALAIAVVSGYFITKFVIKNNHYNEAFIQYEAGNLDSAISLFSNAGNFKNAQENKEILSYYQTYQKMLEEERTDKPIKFAGNTWFILENDKDTLLLFSKAPVGEMALGINPPKSEDSKEYSAWECSSVRAWLNSTYLQENFSESERRMLKETNYYVDGIVVKDKAVLLSKEVSSQPLNWRVSGIFNFFLFPQGPASSPEVFLAQGSQRVFVDNNTAQYKNSLAVTEYNHSPEKEYYVQPVIRIGFDLVKE